MQSCQAVETESCRWCSSTENLEETLHGVECLACQVEDLDEQAREHAAPAVDLGAALAALQERMKKHRVQMARCELLFGAATS